MQRGIFMLMNAKTKKSVMMFYLWLLTKQCFQLIFLNKQPSVICYAFDEINKESFGLLQLGSDGFYVLNDPQQYLQSHYLFLTCFLIEL